MGFYFRKSKSFGPFRLNFSKSGIGFSTGVKGARMSFGPKGTYVNLGSNGVYYRKKIGSKSNVKNNYNNSVPTLPELDTTAISAVNIANESMVESEFEQEFIANIKKATLINTLWAIAILSTSILMFAFPLLSLITIGLIVLKIVFGKCFRAEINYELDETANNKWKDFISSVDLLRNSKKVWLIESKVNVFDTKHNAGAGQNIKRSDIKTIRQIKPQKNNSAKIKCDNSIVEMKTQKCKIIFLPNLIVVINGRSVTGYSYKNLSISASSTRFVENSSVTVPKDAQILEWTWQYVNRNGGPDMRYKQNPKLPVCKYGTLKLSSENGLALEFYISNSNISTILENSWNEYASHITNVLSFDNEKALEEAVEKSLIENSNELEKTNSSTTVLPAFAVDYANTNNRLLKEFLQNISIRGESNE